MAVKQKYSTIKKQFESRGWKLLSKEFLGSIHKLNVICPKGHEIQLTYHSFRATVILNNKYGCRECSGKRNITLGLAKKEASQRGWKQDGEIIPWQKDFSLDKVRKGWQAVLAYVTSL